MQVSLFPNRLNTAGKMDVAIGIVVFLWIIYILTLPREGYFVPTGQPLNLSGGH